MVFRLKVIQKGVKIIPDMQIHLGPVVKACPLDLAAAQGETERSNQMQCSADAEAGSADVAGIPVNFRCHKHYVAFISITFIKWLGHKL